MSNTCFSSSEELPISEEDCKFCSKSTNASLKHLLQRHVRFAVYFKDDGKEKFSIPCMCDKGTGKRRSHWHCPNCQKIICRDTNFKTHLANHGYVLCEYTRMSESELGAKCDHFKVVTGTQKLVELPGDDSLPKCKQCGSAFSTSANLRRHEIQLHNTNTEAIFCVDLERGLFFTSKNKKGQRVPIHIQKSTVSQQIGCELNDCREFMALANLSGKPGVECEHLARVPNAPPFKPPPTLHRASLKIMVDKGLISKKIEKECQELHEMAIQERTCTVYPVFFEDHGYSGNFIYFSIYTGKIERWSCFGRTRVTLNENNGKWFCLCSSSSKESHRCIHIYMGMWWMFQERQGLLTEVQNSDSDVEASEDTHYKSDVCTQEQIIKMTEYLWEKKRIPEILPQDLKEIVRHIPEVFSPEEKNCPYCPGPTPPELEPYKLVTTKASVYGLFTIKRDVKVAVKTCPVCRTQVRFQDHESGFHNYNNKILLSIPLCSMLTTAVKNNTAIGRFVSMMEEHLDINIHQNTFRKAFFHYSAMTQYSYSFVCNRCGDTPPVIIADANWKLAFEIPVNQMKRPRPEDIRLTNLSVNIEERWTDLQKRLIAVGFCDGNYTNPYASQLAYSTFSPWMGRSSRIGPVLPKTEVHKGLSKSVDTSKHTSSSSLEDVLFEVLDSKKPQKAELISACSELGVSSEGSSSDIINRLEELLLYKDIYPKMFNKIQKTGGGVYHAGCMHSVVYYCSPLWWQESARDHTDALLSFRVPPTLYVSDVAGRVARHTNNRTRQEFFQPFDGRLCDTTPANIAKAKEKSLELSFPWTTKIKQLGGPLKRVPVGHQSPHPVTGTSHRYSLYDRFHQTNQKRPEERLRSLDLLPELKGVINSSMSEQLNRELANARYFLCQLKDVHYMFMLRLVFHLHNERRNGEFFEKMCRMAKGNATVGKDGRLCLFGIESGDKQTKDVSCKDESEVVAKENKASVEVDLVEEAEVGNVGHQSFSVGLFPILPENEKKLGDIYTNPENDYAVVKMDQAIVYLRDLESLCPKRLLSDDLQDNLPWLTDDVVNARLIQMARPVQNMLVFPTFRFTLWWRNWVRSKCIEDRNLNCLQDIETDSRVLLPRIVGKPTPETGDHFILWFLDGQKSELRIYDSFAKYKDIRAEDMDILCHAFQSVWNLRNWTVAYPQQWRQRDAVNCGVFVLTAVEMEIRGTEMTNEYLVCNQLNHLRLYHACELVKDTVPKGSKLQENCMAENILACNFYDPTGPSRKRTLYPNEEEEDWVKCETCNGWLHKECAQFDQTQLTDGIFTCGCDFPDNFKCTRTLSVLKEKGVEGLISNERIKELASQLENGVRKSNRMYLWENPGRRFKLRNTLKQRLTIFNYDHTDQLIAIVKKTLSEAPIDFILDVMVPEVTIDSLMNLEGFSRYQAECFLAAGTLDYKG